MNKVFFLMLFLIISNSLLVNTKEKLNKINEKSLKIETIGKNANDSIPMMLGIRNNINELRNDTEYKDIEWKALGPFIPALTDFPNPEVNGNGRIYDIEIDPFNQNNIWLGTASGGLWYSEDNGITWQLNSSSDILSIGVADIEFSKKEQGHIYVVTGDPHTLKRYYSIGIILSKDNGQTWENIFPFEQNDKYQFLDIELYEEIDLMIAASNKGLFKSKISKVEWQLVIENESFGDIDATIGENFNIYASTFDYYNGNTAIYLSTDSAKSFKRVKEYDEVENIKIAVNKQTNDIYAISSDIIFHKMLELIYSTDNGTTWQTIADSSQHLEIVKYQGFFNLLLEVNPIDSNDIFAGGVDLYRSKDHGNSWVKQTGLHVDNHDLIYDKDNIPISANDGGFYRQLDTNKWINLSNGLNITQIYGFLSHPLTDKYINIGTQDNGWQVFYNKNFNAKFSGDFLNAVYHPENSDLVFYTLPRGNIVYSSLSGNAELITPEYFEQRPWFTEIIYSKIYNGIMTGGTNLHLNITVNNGYENIRNEWDKLTNFNDTNKIYSIIEVNDELLFTKESDVYKMVSDTAQKLFELEHRINEIKYFEDENALYVGLESYYNNDAIYRIENEELQNITYNLPALPVNAIEKIDDKIVIGTNGGIYILDNEEWHYYGEKFPPAIVTALNYDKKNNLLNASTYGRGLWQVRFNDCTVPKPQIRTQKENYCKDESVVLEIVDPQDEYTYKWWDGSEGLTKTLDDNFSKYYSLFAISYNEEGCSEISNVINFQIDDTADIKLFLLSRNPICNGDSAVIYVSRNDEKFGDFFWNTGESNDTLTTYKSGTYYHYYRTFNGCYSYSDSVMIEVVEKPIRPLIDQDGIRLVSSTGYRYLWFKNDEIIPSSNTKALKIESPGDYKVRVFNSYGCYFDSDIYSISLKNNTKEFDYSIKPNPVVNSIDFEIFIKNEQDISLTIYDVAGRKYFHKRYKSMDGYYAESIDVTELSQGVYLFELKSENVKKYSKFIKIK